jgi:hypothetical protein
MGNRSTGEGYAVVKILFDELYRDYHHLWFDNYKESGFLPEHEYSVDVERYRNLEGNSCMFIVGLKFEDKIVGYAAVVTDIFLHSKDVLFAKIDTVYIDKSHRNLKAFRELINYVENTVRFYKIKHIFISAMTKRPLDALFKRLKYSPIEIVYSKEL